MVSIKVQTLFLAIWLFLIAKCEAIPAKSPSHTKYLKSNNIYIAKIFWIFLLWRGENLLNITLPLLSGLLPLEFDSKGIFHWFQWTFWKIWLIKISWGWRDMNYRKVLFCQIPFILHNEAHVRRIHKILEEKKYHDRCCLWISFK